MTQAMQNPFGWWQNTMTSMMTESVKNFGTLCSMAAPAAKPSNSFLPFDPFSLSPLLQNNPFLQNPFLQQNPFMQSLQQGMTMWQSFLAPAAKSMATHSTPAGAWPFVGATEAAAGMKPKVTVMTVELGDMGPMMKQAGDFLAQWQNMWLSNLSGQKQD